MKKPNETEQWLLEQSRASLFFGETNETPEQAEARRFGKMLWPFMLPYFSPLRPAFSFEVNLAANFLRQRTWLLRDGAIPLSWFFHSAGPQLAEMTNIIVHSSLGMLVPQAWRKNTRYFRNFARETFGPGKHPENIFLSGPVSAGITSIAELERILDGVIAGLGEPFKGKVLVYCPVRQLEFVRAEEQSFEFQFYHQIFSRFGKKVQFVHWGQIEHKSFRNTAFVDLNGGWIYKDGFMMHQTLSRGAGLIGAPEPEAPDTTRLNLSPHHGMIVSNFPGRNEYLIDEEASSAQDFFTALQKHSIDPPSHFPWPKWYQGFTRAALSSLQN